MPERSHKSPRRTPASALAQLICLITALPGTLFVTACRIDEGKDPDRAPEGGFNPVKPQESTEATQNQLEPLDPLFGERCTATLEEKAVTEGEVAFLEIKLANELANSQATHVTLRDPSRLDYTRDWIQILETGIYTIQVTFGQGKGCWTGVEVGSEDTSYTLTISNE
jgi:hypothetical protein